MSRKDTLNSLFMGRRPQPAAAPAGGADPAAPSVTPAPVHREGEKERVRTGAISAMGASLQQLTEGARTAARLQEQIASGTAVIDLDPAVIDGSMVKDRLEAEVDPGFEALVRSIAESGQQVPILVRPHPAASGRYQAAYGHRRLRAAARLGVPVKAVVRPLSDVELVIAQGKENLDREQLSFIEKALFARRLEDQGFDRATLGAALSTDKGDLSRYIAVARLIPESVLIAIGPARKAGRARWLTLAERLKAPRADRIMAELLQSPGFRAAESDVRFMMVLEALDRKSRPRGRARPEVRVWKAPGAGEAGRIEISDTQTVLTFDDSRLPAFGRFVAGELDALYARFLAAREDNGEA